MKKRSKKSLKKPKEPEELSDDQFQQLITAVEQFDEQFFIALAGTRKYEIVPTFTDHGQPLTEEQYSLIRHECSRLGSSIIYKTELPDGVIVYTSVENKKVGYIHEGMH
jgi:hypothetical protein